MGFPRSLTPIVGAAATVAAMVVLPGCGLILDFDPWPPAPMDAGSDRDGSVAVMDGGPDMMRDGSMRDARVAPADAAPDTSVEDARTDDGSPDSWVPDVPCADGTVDQTYAGHPEMVGCDGALDQCTAETLCGSGWRLCMPAEYEARGGGSAPATAARWLAGCMRLGSCASTGGIPSICGDCSVESAAPLAVFGNSCPGAMRLESVDCPVGVIASTMAGPYRLDGFTECMHAEVASTDVLLGAACCR